MSDEKKEPVLIYSDPMELEQQLELCKKLAENDIKNLSPKDRLLYGISVAEFFKAKLQRSPFEPLNSDEFQIKIVNGDD